MSMRSFRTIVPFASVIVFACVAGWYWFSMRHRHVETNVLRLKLANLPVDSHFDDQVKIIDEILNIDPRDGEMVARRMSVMMDIAVAMPEGAEQQRKMGEAVEYARHTAASWPNNAFVQSALSTVLVEAGLVDKSSSDEAESQSAATPSSNASWNAKAAGETIRKNCLTVTEDCLCSLDGDAHNGFNITITAVNGSRCYYEYFGSKYFKKTGDGWLRLWEAAFGYGFSYYHGTGMADYKWGKMDSGTGEINEPGLDPALIRKISIIKAICAKTPEKIDKYGNLLASSSVRITAGSKVYTLLPGDALRFNWADPVRILDDKVRDAIYQSAKAASSISHNPMESKEIAVTERVQDCGADWHGLSIDQ